MFVSFIAYRGRDVPTMYLVYRFVLLTPAKQEKADTKPKG
jgi:hypothetical protein